MAGHRFKNIIAALLFTDIPLPYFKDKFFEVSHVIDALNQRIQDLFIPSWLYCLYESIYVWSKKFTCLVWMLFPRKPHPKGN